MMPPLRLREYIQPAKPARQRAASEQNLHAKRVLEEMERSYYRLVEIQKWGRRFSDGVARSLGAIALLAR
jgi:hypothetical protein